MTSSSARTAAKRAKREYTTCHQRMAGRRAVTPRRGLSAVAARTCPWPKSACASASMPRCYYRLVDGSPSGEQDNHKYAQAPLVDLYGLTAASEFGPLKLKAVRQKMIDTYRYLVRFADGEETWERWVPESRFRERAGQGDQWRGRVERRSGSRSSF